MSYENKYDSAFVFCNKTNKDKWILEPGFLKNSVIFKDKQNRLLGINKDKKIFVSKTKTHIASFSWFIKKNIYGKGNIIESIYYNYIFNCRY